MYWKEKIEPWIGRDGIDYVGPVDDVQKNELLGKAAAMVVPIQWDEPFGIVFAESLACGTPVIACPRGALPEIVRPGVDGFLIKSIEEGAEAVAKVGALDRAACRQRAEQHFSAQAVVTRYIDLYERLRSGADRGMSGRLALVSGHFPPSNLVGAHRARLWSRYLPEFGWEPIVVTGDPDAYEEKPDPDLERLVAPGLRVIHAATLSTRPVKIVGDIGVRSFYGCYKALAKLAANREIDFVLVTIPSNYPGAGRSAHPSSLWRAVRHRLPGSVGAPLVGRRSTVHPRLGIVPTGRAAGADGGARCRADHRHGAGLCRGHARAQSRGRRAAP